MKYSKELRKMSTAFAEDSYICKECGAEMELLNDTLLCPKCNTILKFYDYEDWYPSPDTGYTPDIPILGHDDELSEKELSEYYEEWYDEEDW